MTIILFLVRKNGISLESISLHVHFQQSTAAGMASAEEQKLRKLKEVFSRPPKKSASTVFEFVDDDGEVAVRASFTRVVVEKEPRSR